MAKKASSAKQKTSKPRNSSRQERRFSTSSTFMATWVVVVGFIGCFVLGCGVFDLWIQDPAGAYGSYLVAAGGFGLGLALWFAQPPEVAVAVGDAGVAIENGKETIRVSWYDLRALQIRGDQVVAEGKTQGLHFSLGANPYATAYLLKETAQRVPDALDVDKSVMQKLPSLDESHGVVRKIEDDQVAGMRCASSQKLIHLEEEARLCPTCGQVYHRDALPDRCANCETSLKGNSLLA